MHEVNEQVRDLLSLERKNEKKKFERFESFRFRSRDMHMLRDGSRRLISLDENDETGISRQGFETRSKSLSYGTAPCLKLSALMPIFSGFSTNPKIRFTYSFVETKIGNRLIFFIFSNNHVEPIRGTVEK